MINVCDGCMQKIFLSGNFEDLKFLPLSSLRFFSPIKGTKLSGIHFFYFDIIFNIIAFTTNLFVPMIWSLPDSVPFGWKYICPSKIKWSNQYHFNVQPCEFSVRNTLYSFHDVSN